MRKRRGVVLQLAEARLNQIKEYRTKGVELTGLAFVAGQKPIEDLMQQQAARTIEVAKLAERYREKHPEMISARRSFEQTKLELERAINSVCEQVIEYKSALTNFRRGSRNWRRTRPIRSNWIGRVEYTKSSVNT